MDFSQISIEEVFQVGCSIFEIALLNPEIQISGVVVIMDLTGMTLIQQARLINPRFAWQLTNCIQVNTNYLSYLLLIYSENKIICRLDGEY